MSIIKIYRISHWSRNIHEYIGPSITGFEYLSRYVRLKIKQRVFPATQKNLREKFLFRFKAINQTNLYVSRANGESINENSVARLPQAFRKHVEVFPRVNPGVILHCP